MFSVRLARFQVFDDDCLGKEVPEQSRAKVTIVAGKLKEIHGEFNRATIVGGWGWKFKRKGFAINSIKVSPCERQ